MLPLRNQIREKNARLSTLTTSENYDKDKVNALVKEIGDLRTQMMMTKVEHRQEIRSLLNEEQQINFDLLRQKKLDKKMRHGFRR